MKHFCHIPRSASFTISFPLNCHLNIFLIIIYQQLGFTSCNFVNLSSCFFGAILMLKWVNVLRRYLVVGCVRLIHVDITSVDKSGEPDGRGIGMTKWSSGYKALIIPRRDRRSSEIKSIGSYYWKCNFPMAPHVRLLVGGLVGLSMFS